jgi:hypothetical protein
MQKKCERGVNRVGASKPYYLGQTLGVPVAYYFEDMPVAFAWNGRSKDLPRN